MTIAYVDTSCLLSIAFAERGAAAMARRIQEHDDTVAANLLEAEFRSALRRQGLNETDTLLLRLRWVIPDRPLTAEIKRVLAIGYARGADLWHLAVALYFAANAGEITFLTLDEPQRRVASALGFKT